MVGNIIIYQPGKEDEGLYQCMAANSEGVVFSRVVKVRMRKRQGKHFFCKLCVYIINTAEMHFECEDNCF